MKTIKKSDLMLGVMAAGGSLLCCYFVVRLSPWSIFAAILVLACVQLLVMGDRQQPSSSEELFLLTWIAAAHDALDQMGYDATTNAVRSLLSLAVPSKSFSGSDLLEPGHSCGYWQQRAYQRYEREIKERKLLYLQERFGRSQQLQMATYYMVNGSALRKAPGYQAKLDLYLGVLGSLEFQNPLYTTAYRVVADLIFTLDDPLLGLAKWAQDRRSNGGSREEVEKVRRQALFYAVFLLKIILGVDSISDDLKQYAAKTEAALIALVMQEEAEKDGILAEAPPSFGLSAT